MLLKVPNSTINESEFNNVHRNMVKMIFNINDNAHDPPWQGVNSGEHLSTLVKLQDNNHEKNVKAKRGRRRPRSKRFSKLRQQSVAASGSTNSSCRNDGPRHALSAVVENVGSSQHAEGTDLLDSDFIPAIPITRTLLVQDSSCTVSPMNRKPSTAQIYSRLMLARELGYPLYTPEPNRRLGSKYRKRGVRIGDVGRITPSGSFDFLFNACRSENHPINPEVLPIGFDVLKPIEISVSDNFGPNTFLLGGDVKQTRKSPIEYQCAGPEGAILVLPRGSTLFEALNTADFQKHAARHAVSWYEYMNKKKGRDAENGSLYFVTGCIKSKNWGIGTFYGGETNGNSLQFVADEATDSGCGQYRWETSGRTIARMGPVSRKRAKNEKLNQCTFISGFKIMLQEDEWERLTETVTVSSSGSRDSGFQPDGKPRGSSGASGQSSATTMNQMQPQGGSSGNRSTRLHRSHELKDIVIKRDFTTASPVHPSDFINVALLQAARQARVAITHDDCWKKALPKQFMANPSNLQPDELLSSISDFYDQVIDEFGSISLVKTTHINDQSENEAAGDGNHSDSSSCASECHNLPGRNITTLGLESEEEPLDGTNMLGAIPEDNGHRIRVDVSIGKPSDPFAIEKKTSPALGFNFSESRDVRQDAKTHNMASEVVGHRFGDWPADGPYITGSEVVGHRFGDWPADGPYITGSSFTQTNDNVDMASEVVGHRFGDWPADLTDSIRRHNESVQRPLTPRLWRIVPQVVQMPMLPPAEQIVVPPAEQIVIPPAEQIVFKQEVGTAKIATAAHKRRKKNAGFKCRFSPCTATFTARHNLQYHINTHLGIKPYPCTKGCSYRATNPATATRHSRTCKGLQNNPPPLA